MATKTAASFGSATWANEPPSEEERIIVRKERASMRAVLAGDRMEISSLLASPPFVDINFVSSGNCTMLHAAAARGDLEICTFLIDKGANMQALNSLGYTPLLSAAASGKSETVDFMVKKGANAKVLSKRGLGVSDLLKTAAMIR